MSDLDVLLLAADSLAKASTPEPWSKNPLWHKKPLHLPFYVQHISQHLARTKGMSESEAIALAIGIVKRWASGRPSGGEKKVHPDTVAAAKKALAEWEADKAATRGGKK